ncbi:MAG: ribonuclease Z [Methanobacteriota archaeon]|nr:MAG: ribonuclease Z [Euryarchaeota archaeon]
MRLIFLGTGGTYPSKERNVTSIAVQVGPDVVMFDCGEGTQRQLMYSPVSFMRIRSIFLTHLHADHFLGLPGLVQSMSLNGRTEALRVFGPENTEATVDAMLGLGHFSSRFEVSSKDMEPGDAVDFGSYVVSAAEASHTVPALAFAVEEKPRPGKFQVERAEELGVPKGPKYRVLQEGGSVEVDGAVVRPEDVIGGKRPGRKVVYSGDTRPCESVKELSAGADVLVHDSTLSAIHSDIATEFGHSTAAQAAEVAKAAGVGKLYLTHISPRYDDESLLLSEATSIFTQSTIAHDLDVIDVRVWQKA